MVCLEEYEVCTEPEEFYVTSLLYSSATLVSSDVEKLFDVVSHGNGSVDDLESSLNEL